MSQMPDDEDAVNEMEELKNRGKGQDDFQSHDDPEKVGDIEATKKRDH